MVCVLARGGKPLMPTNIRRARRLLRKGRAVIAGHHPFTIRLLDREDDVTQPIEYKCDGPDRTFSEVPPKQPHSGEDL